MDLHLRDFDLGALFLFALTFFYCMAVMQRFPPGKVVIGKEGWPTFFYLLPAGIPVVLSIICDLARWNENLWWDWAVVAVWVPMMAIVIYRGPKRPL